MDDAEAAVELDRRLEGWVPDLVGTLLFLAVEDRVLLIRKRRGHGVGKINGPGGKLEPGESPAQCAVRETLEETGVQPLGPRLAALFRFVDTCQPDWLGYVYTAHAYTGAPRTTAEGIPHWYPTSALPLEEMWDDDRHWLPRVLAGERLYGDFLFADSRLVAHRIGPLPDGGVPGIDMP